MAADAAMVKTVTPSATLSAANVEVRSLKTRKMASAPTTTACALSSSTATRSVGGEVTGSTAGVVDTLSTIPGRRPSLIVAGGETVAIGRVAHARVRGRTT